MKAAVIQAAPKMLDMEETLARFARLAARAAEAGAKLAVFPEAFIGGYPKLQDFGARVGTRSDAGRDRYADYAAHAITLPGPELAAMGEIARDTGLYITTGVIERDGGTLYCTSLYLGDDGRMLGRHRKVMPTAMERLIWGFGDGSTLDVYETPLGRLGSAICWENYMPLLRAHLYQQGIELYCAPTVDDRDQWQHTMRHIAVEGRCFVLTACQYAVRDDYPEAWHDMLPDKSANAPVIRGGSVIVSPMGRVLAGPVYGEEAVLTADLDFTDIPRGKYDLDVAGHYARRDIFSLSVDRTERG